MPTWTCDRLLPPRHSRARLLAIIILALAPFLFGALALGLGQDANWDLRNYHWYNAYAFLNGRYDVDFLPSQIPFFYNPLLDVPFYLLATHVSSQTATFVLGAVQGLNFVLLFLIAFAALRLENKGLQTLISAVLAALGVLGGGGISLLGTTFGDNLTSLGVLLTILLVIISSDLFRGSWRTSGILALMFGVIPGCMMGLKLPNVIFCVGLCFALLGVEGVWHKRLRLSFIFGLGILLGVAVSFGHWAWYLQNHFGNPLFPYFNDYFKSPMIAASNLRDTKFLPLNLKEFLLFPFVFAANPYHVGEIPWRDWRLPVLYFLLPLSLLLRFFVRRHHSDILIEPHARRYLLWVGSLSYLAWLILFSIYRYMIPLEMLAPLLIVCVVDLWPLGNCKRICIAAILLTIVAVTIIPGNWTRRTSWTDHFVETKIPPLGTTSDLMILMAGIEPYSHLIPQFPGDISFVRIQSNFSSPEQDNGTNRLIKDRIFKHKGRFMMLIPVWNMGDAHRAMSYFKLDFDRSSCQDVQDKLYDANVIKLCPVVRLTRE